MLDHPEDAGRVIRIGKPIAASPCGACSLLDRVEFRHGDSPAVVDTYVKGWKSFVCQYVSGPHEGEQFELGQSQLEAALGEPIVLETDEAALVVPNIYTQQTVRQQQRGLIGLAVVGAVGLALSMYTNHRAPDSTPPAPPAAKKASPDPAKDATQNQERR